MFFGILLVAIAPLIIEIIFINGVLMIVEVWTFWTLNHLKCIYASPRDALSKIFFEKYFQNMTMYLIGDFIVDFIFFIIVIIIFVMSDEQNK